MKKARCPLTLALATRLTRRVGDEKSRSFKVFQTSPAVFGVCVRPSPSCVVLDAADLTGNITTQLKITDFPGKVKSHIRLVNLEEVALKISYFPL